MTRNYRTDESRAVRTEDLIETARRWFTLGETPGRRAIVFELCARLEARPEYVMVRRDLGPEVMWIARVIHRDLTGAPSLVVRVDSEGVISSLDLTVVTQPWHTTPLLRGEME